jgi:hypothetical protein
VTCNSAYEVIGLNLTSLNIQMPGDASLSLSSIIRVLQPLSSVLASLDAATMQLAGTLPTSLVEFYNLEQLNISGNKRLIGSLPSIWSALTALRSVDVSGTGIRGSLPASWASLQELRSFRAAHCSSLSGQLPLEWGILKNLDELVVTNSQISGVASLDRCRDGASS